MEEVSTKPYLLRALYEWCVDNGYTPHLGVKVDSRCQVPLEYVRDGEIVLNIAPTAVHKLQMGNELIEFSARFAGVARQVSVPVGSVHALFSKETKHGMTFEVSLAPSEGETAGDKRAPSNEPGPAPVPAAALPAPTTAPTKPTGGRPQLRRIK